MISGRRILITGSSGYLGRAIVRMLLAQPALEVLVGVDIRPSPALTRQRDARLRLVVADVADPLDHLLQEYRIDTVLHAAFVLRPSHNLRRMRQTNIEGTRQILRACSACGVEHLLYISSASVYGFVPQQTAPFRETAPLNPMAGFMYAEHKAESDRLVQNTRSNGLIAAITVLRPSFIIGGESDNPLYEHLSRRLVLLPDRMSSLQLTHIDDFCSAVLLVLERRANESYNLGAAGCLSPLQMVQRLHGRAILFPQPLLHVCNDIAWNLRARWITNCPSSAISSLEGYWLVNSEKIESQMSFSFRYDTEQSFDSWVRERLRQRYESRFGIR
ncbi:MAG: NAD-dependent epimerase/dehydratase family protein [Terracidiphilus sp.]